MESLWCVLELFGFFLYVWLVGDSGTVECFIFVRNFTEPVIIVWSQYLPLILIKDFNTGIDFSAMYCVYTRLVNFHFI